MRGWFIGAWLALLVGWCNGGSAVTVFFWAVKESW